MSFRSSGSCPTLKIALNSDNIEQDFQRRLEIVSFDRMFVASGVGNNVRQTIDLTTSLAALRVRELHDQLRKSKHGIALFVAVLPPESPVP